MSDILKKRLINVDFSWTKGDRCVAKIHQAFENCELETVEDLVKYDLFQMVLLPNFGRNSLARIVNFLRQEGLPHCWRSKEPSIDYGWYDAGEHRSWS